MVTGLAAGALVTVALIALVVLGELAGLPSVAFTVFEWLIRVLPGRLVVFGLELTLRVLENLGLNIKNTAKTAEEVLALTSLFVAGCLISALFFGLVRSQDPPRVSRYGRAVGAVIGTFSLVITLTEQPPGLAGVVLATVWILGLFQLWGWCLALLYLRAVPSMKGSLEVPETQVSGRTTGSAPARETGSMPAQVQPQAAGPPAVEVTRLDRRRFLIRVGGLVATFVVCSAPS